MAVQEIVGDAFDREVLESDLPVVVDFYADWCMPCRALAPEMETLSERWAGRARFVKVDVDRAPRAQSAVRGDLDPHGRAVPGR